MNNSFNFSTFSLKFKFEEELESTFEIMNIIDVEEIFFSRKQQKEMNRARRKSRFSINSQRHIEEHEDQAY